ncbi:hypothetical protein TRICI_000195 [Trichomonascus ciferrii]|uniref:Uncharacterized protein n=1 Tax=Trichomonascus ciferrii TaxID=44093 RepID=A0A642VE44_9ASCO|nr:hypothetical protein TRICI_000195 [Trichomonascus ciferrii]
MKYEVDKTDEEHWGSIKDVQHDFMSFNKSVFALSEFNHADKVFYPKEGDLDVKNPNVTGQGSVSLHIVFEFESDVDKENEHDFLENKASQDNFGSN